MLYLDTSFIAPLFIAEDTSDDVERYLQDLGEDLSTSDWTRVEFSSLLARRIRMKELDVAQAETIRKTFDAMLSSSFQMLTISSTDCVVAAQLLCDPSTGLRAGDALHFGIIHNHFRPSLLSLDRGMVKAAQLLGFSASTGIPTNNVK